MIGALTRHAHDVTQIMITKGVASQTPHQLMSTCIFTSGARSPQIIDVGVN